jgi:hypothetical protein
MTRFRICFQMFFVSGFRGRCQDVVTIRARLLAGVLGLGRLPRPLGVGSLLLVDHPFAESRRRRKDSFPQNCCRYRFRSIVHPPTPAPRAVKTPFSRWPWRPCASGTTCRARGS